MSSGAFDDIGGHRHCCPANLVRQAELFVLWEGRGGLIDRKCYLVSQLKSTQVTVVTHCRDSIDL